MRYWLWLLLWLPVVASPTLTTVEFATEPANVDVYFQSATNTSLEEFQGSNREPLVISLDRFRDRSAVQVLFRRRGYRDKRETIPLYLLQESRYPQRGLVRLEPLHWWIPARTFAVDHPLGAALGLSLLGGLILAFGQSRRRLRKRLEFVDTFESYAPDHSADPLILSTLGGFRLVERIGAGGTASVYKAIRDEQVTAIKLMDRNSLWDSEARERFRREAKTLSELSHPSLLKVFDYGEENGVPYLVTELIEGNTLRRHIVERGLAPAAVWRLLAPLGEGLAYAHERDVIHRDLKPENVLVSPDGGVKLVDFGLARVGGYQTLTQTGQPIGTPTYMAPEQALDGKEVVAATDQYSLGVIAYELLTGRPPFMNPDPMKRMFQHIRDQPDALTEHRSDVDLVVQKHVLRMLAKAPEDRFPSTREAWQTLEKALKDWEES